MICPRCKGVLDDDPHICVKEWFSTTTNDLTIEATKSDSEKPQMHYLPPQALIEVAKVFTYGAKKYSAYNYRNGQGLDWTRVADAAQRHLQAWLSGEDLDPETNLSHLAHMVCSGLMLMDLQKRNKGTDDRPKY